MAEAQLEAEVKALSCWCEFVAVAFVGTRSHRPAAELVSTSVRNASMSLQAPDLLCALSDGRFVVVAAGSGEAADRFDLFAERLHRQGAEPLAVGYAERRLGDAADDLLQRARRRFDAKRSPVAPIAVMRFSSDVQERRSSP